VTDSPFSSGRVKSGAFSLTSMTKYLYRKAMQVVTLGTAIVVFSFSIQAQFRVPQPERKTPRAVGVLETFKNGSRRLVPVTFFYEKRYYDATFYHATPVPFTLYSETVYEVQQLGKPLGTFTVQSATQNSAAWFGNGRFKAAPDAATLAKKAAPAPVVVEDSSRPVLHRKEGSEGDNPQAHPAPAKGATAAEEDPDRPKLHRKDDSTASTGTAPAAPSAPASKTSGGTKSGTQSGTQAGGQSAAQSAPQSAPQAANQAEAKLTPSDDPDHPVLRRGKPIQEQAGRDLPDFKKEEPVSRMVAVSDAGTSELQPLIYLSTEEERNRIEAQARELASSELRKVAAQRGLGPLAPQKTAVPVKMAAGKKGAAKAGESKLPELKFEDEQFVPFDLDYNNYATVVYSGRYTPDPAQAKSWVVTVIARQDESKLVKLHSTVSDPRELDLYPEVRLVDAVDADGYGRAALLFREKKRDGVSWLLGRVTGYELQTLLETPSR
jgi:hypothetical protein